MTRPSRQHVPVNCSACECEFKKRHDSIKTWSGLCKSCSMKRVAEMPHIKKAKPIWAKRQVERMGGIPNGNRFTSADGGENHWNWQGGITAKRLLEMGKAKYILWRKSVFARDDYTCQECGIRGGRLDSHHIKAWATHEAERYDLSNGMTLCRPCHVKTPNYGRKAITG